MVGPQGGLEDCRGAKICSQAVLELGRGWSNRSPGDGSGGIIRIREDIVYERRHRLGIHTHMGTDVALAAIGREVTGVIEGDRVANAVRHVKGSGPTAIHV